MNTRSSFQNCSRVIPTKSIVFVLSKLEGLMNERHLN